MRQESEFTLNTFYIQRGYSGDTYTRQPKSEFLYIKYTMTIISAFYLLGFFHFDIILDSDDSVYTLIPSLQLRIT